jgi:RNA polymerase primary sigma factor
VEPDYSWQDDAIERWVHATPTCCGIVEAVTGTGKTYVGIKALERMERKAALEGFHLVPVVVVPSAVLMAQWYERLSEAFPDRKIGRLGHGHHDGFHQLCDVIIGIINSVVNRRSELLAFITRNDYRPLLIADECHRYLDGKHFQKLLKMPFQYRLGLTPRMPPGESIDYNIPGLGGIVRELAMPEARRLGLIPPFHLLNIPIQLTPEEMNEYETLSDRARSEMERLKPKLPKNCISPYDDIVFSALKKAFLNLSDSSPLKADIARLYCLFFRRASIYHTASAKVTMVKELIRLLNQHNKKTMVFFERIASADAAETEISAEYASLLQMDILRGHETPVWCKVLHSGLDRNQQRRVLDEFGTPGSKVLISCRSLDEGFDIPEVDCAILAASTQSKRQRIQRIGRVLRRYSDNKRSFIVTLYSPGTSDARVCLEDREMFPGPTDVFDCKSNNWRRTLTSLLEYYRDTPDLQQG